MTLCMVVGFKFLVMLIKSGKTPMASTATNKGTKHNQNWIIVNTSFFFDKSKQIQGIISNKCLHLKRFEIPAILTDTVTRIGLTAFKKLKMSRLFMPLIFVGIGGLVGSCARFLISAAFQKNFMILPFGTLSANLLGCFIIGILSQLMEQTSMISQEARLFLTSGFCGGLTTLSTSIYEVAQLLRASEWLHAFIYSGITSFGSFFAFYLGIYCIKLLVK
jgi:fluoride exporter